MKNRTVVCHVLSLIFLGLIPFSVWAQLQGQERVDSMVAILPKLAEDTDKVNTLNRISFAIDSHQPKAGIEYGQQALALANKLEWSRGIASAYNSIGCNYLACNNNAKALIHFNLALDLNEKLNDDFRIAQNLGNIALVYQNLGNYPKALENLFKALKTFEKMGDQTGMANQYGNIGNIYQESGNARKAVYYDSLALIEFKKMGDLSGQANQLSNIANALSDSVDSKRAIAYNKEALNLYEKLNETDGIIRVTNNIAVCYESIDEYSKAFAYHFRAMQLNKKLQLVSGLIINNGNIGELYLKLSDSNAIEIGSPYLPKNPASRLKLAIGYLKEAVTLASKNLDPVNLVFYLERYAFALEKNKDFKGALLQYKKYRELDDSIYTVENAIKIENLTTEREVELKNKQIEIDSLEVEKKRERELFFIAGIIALLCLTGLVFRNYRRQKVLNGALSVEKQKSDDLLLNILPAEVAEELKTKGYAEAKLIDMVTVLFTDFKGFTTLSEELSPKDLVAEINECFSAFDHIMQKNGIEKIKTIGDAYMAAGGLPVVNVSHAKDVVMAALAIQKFMYSHNVERVMNKKPIFEIRIGIHTGPVVAGIVGVKKFAYDIWGDTVNTASRMESSGEAGRINISGSTYEMVKHQFECEYRGKIQAKGKGEIDMYFIRDGIV